MRVLLAAYNVMLLWITGAFLSAGEGGLTLTSDPVSMRKLWPSVVVRESRRDLVDDEST